MTNLDLGIDTRQVFRQRHNLDRFAFVGLDLNSHAHNTRGTNTQLPAQLVLSHLLLALVQAESVFSVALRCVALPCSTLLQHARVNKPFCFH
jgi:hypothetical protein